MEERSFYTFCISACIFLVFVNLCVIFVTALGVFPYQGATTIPGGNNPVSVVGNLTGQNSGFLSLFTGNIGELTTIGALIGVGGLTIVTGFALFSGNWNILAAYLFTVIFWGLWVNSLSIFSNGGLFDYSIIAMLITIISVGMFFIFIGAVAGLLHLGEG